MTEQKVCSSTKERITNDAGSVEFACPQCSETNIIRSSRARTLAIKYKCEKCGFTGPN
ncbi:RNA-binding protein [Candidatus Woesearchaeota archaeon]|nr:RNA-binding protein [Candidatus Woesearchaeota archaeon]